MKQLTAGPNWFDLPAPSEADLPRLLKEVEALRLRNQLDPKRFYKKDEGEGKGIKGLPKFFGVNKLTFHWRVTSHALNRSANFWPQKHHLALQVMIISFEHIASAHLSMSS